jgi:HK97 family phage major capsid protein
VRQFLQERGLIRQPEYERLRFGDFLRAMITGAKNDLEKRALAEGTDSAGGYSVPDIVLSRFIDKLRAAAVFIM